MMGTDPSSDTEVALVVGRVRRDVEQALDLVASTVSDLIDYGYKDEASTVYLAFRALLGARRAVVTLEGKRR